jgi:hypothetical protein
MAITIDAALHDHRCKWRGDRELACEPLRAGLGGELVDEDLLFGLRSHSENKWRTVGWVRSPWRV